MPLRLTKEPGYPNYYARGTIGGRRIRQSLKTSDKKIAEAKLAQLAERLIKCDLLGEEEVVTFQEAVLSYLEAEKRKESTLEHVRKLLAHFEGVRLKDINQAAVDRAARNILRHGASPATKIRNIITPITAIMNHAAKRGWCDTPKFERPKQARGRIRWLYPAEADRLIDEHPAHLRPLILFLFYSGARMSEALELDWEQVHLGRGFVEFIHTKTDTARSVPINARVIAALANLSHRKGRVFLSARGAPFADNDRTHGGHIAGPFGRACERAGIAEFRPHDCRHTWATWLYNETRDLILLQQYGGWANLNMVTRYAHVIPRHVELNVSVLPETKNRQTQIQEIG